MSKVLEALEKAQGQRDGEWPADILSSPLDQTVAELDPEGGIEPSRKPEEAIERSMDPVPPQYATFRRVHLDPALLEKNRCVGFFPYTGEMEYYRILKSKILKIAAEGKGNTLMVTSALPGEGKTLTAINLAFAIAKEVDKKVLLVDCDLKKQGIHERLGFTGEEGLIDYLQGNCTLGEITIWPGVDKITLISGGKAEEESSELLGSPRMKELVERLKAEDSDRFVVFDLPPVLVSADALAFAPQVDHILFVVEAGRTPQKEIVRGLALLPREKIIGLVLNQQEAGSIPNYENVYGKYGYGKYGGGGKSAKAG